VIFSVLFDVDFGNATARVSKEETPNGRFMVIFFKLQIVALSKSTHRDRYRFEEAVVFWLSRLMKVRGAVRHDI
jgi:hypothetical protein